MTPSDPNNPGRQEGQGNPFDTGLPMLRVPTGKARKRRRSATRRNPMRRRDPEVYVPEPHIPEHPPNRLRRTGDWEEWLDPPVAGEPPEPLDEPDRHATRAAELPPESYDDNAAPPPAIINRSGIHPGVPLRHPTRRRDQQPRGNKVLAILIVLGVGIAVASILATAINGFGSSTPSTAATSSAPAVPGPTGASTATSAPPPAQASALATQGCEQKRTADVVSGTDPGGTANGPDAILAFEYAYYVERSGYRARAVVADNAIVSPADQIQRGINLIPVGTRYCVQISRSRDGDDGLAHWEVQLTQQYPGEQPRTFTQLITTRTLASRTLITAIASA
ncbi:hypothetical protein [Nocardia altamirensis]|uniref:hypothetical protein n=1 Tax=Nocardia altamirensis TaxID=472158 RepID=UPI000AC76A1C|nr:hypothetical protein [Nocardia altamirensis]